MSGICLDTYVHNTDGLLWVKWVPSTMATKITRMWILSSRNSESSYGGRHGNVVGMLCPDKVQKVRDWAGRMGVTGRYLN